MKYETVGRSLLTVYREYLPGNKYFPVANYAGAS